MIGGGAITSAGLGDVLVAKLDPNGASLLYSSYLGGSGDEITFEHVLMLVDGETVVDGGALAVLGILPKARDIVATVRARLAG